MKSQKQDKRRVDEENANIFRRMKFFIQLIFALFKAKGYIVLSLNPIRQEGSSVVTETRIQSFGFKRKTVVEVLSQSLEKIIIDVEKDSEAKEIVKHLSQVPDDFLKGLNLGNTAPN
jgi:predicted AAA+ superfamily ATPase